MDFEKIHTNLDPYRGPAQGHSGGEHGDNWSDAVAKINGNFDMVKEALEGGGLSDSAQSNDSIVAIAEEQTALRAELDSANARLAALEEFFNAPASDDPPPADPSDPGAVPPPPHEPGA